MKNLCMVGLLLFTFSAYAQKKPSWVNDPSKKCQKSEICVVGTGINKDAATADANVQLARVFNNEVSSEFSQTVNAKNNNVDEVISESINQKTNVILKGVIIGEGFDDGESYHVFASLNKSKAAQTIKSEIDALDEKIKGLMQGKGTGAIKQAEKLFNERQILNQRHQFLTGRSIATDVSFTEIISTNMKQASDFITHLYLDEDEPKEIEQFLAQELSKSGYKITRGQVLNKNANFIITGEFISEKQYLNVEGFEKYAFHLKLSAKDSAKKISTGELKISATETGRNYSQAQEKAISQIKEQLEERISELNIEKIN